jgi:long-chain acyl-CoA synthetase
VFFPETLETFAEDLSSCQPDMFFGVPRIYAKFQEKILDKIPQKKLDTLLKIPVLNTILKRKLREKLGLKNAKLVGSGAAPLSVDIMNWYEKLGIEIRQVYGMTEDGCVSHINWPTNKKGSVGKAFEGVQTKFTPEGELLIKNKCLMKGYFKNPELTASVFDEDGFFRTGDKGVYDHEGNLTIIGRAKDEFKTDKGKYVSPAFLELEISKNTDIDNICVVGTGIPQPIALITLSELGFKKKQEELADGLVKTIMEVNPKFEKHEKIEKVVVMKESWTVDNGLMTPSLKIKRNAIEKLHQPFYPSWFNQEEIVIFE